MIFGGVQDCNQDANNAFGIHSVRKTMIRVGRDGVTGEKGACEVADGRYDYGEIIAAIPEAIVGCLITEDLDGVSSSIWIPFDGQQDSPASDQRQLTSLGSVMLLVCCHIETF